MAYSVNALNEVAEKLETSYKKYFDDNFYNFLECLNELCGISITFKETCDFQDSVFKMAMMSQKVMKSENIDNEKIKYKKIFGHLIIITKMSIKKMMFDTKIEIIKEKEESPFNFVSDIKPSKKFRMSFDSHSENDEISSNDSDSSNDTDDSASVSIGTSSSSFNQTNE